MVDIQSPIAEIRRGEKEERKKETTGQKYNGLPCPIPQGGHNYHRHIARSTTSALLLVLVTVYLVMKITFIFKVVHEVSKEVHCYLKQTVTRDILPYRPPITDEGQIWCARADPRSTITGQNVMNVFIVSASGGQKPQFPPPCQISPPSVHVQRVAPEARKPQNRPLNKLNTGVLRCAQGCR